MTFDWTTVAILVPAVVLVFVLIFHIGSWKGKLDHILEHGHEVKK